MIDRLKRSNREGSPKDADLKGRQTVSVTRILSCNTQSKAFVR